MEECREEHSGGREQHEPGHRSMNISGGGGGRGSLRFLLRLQCRGIVGTLGSMSESLK